MTYTFNVKYERKNGAIGSTTVQSFSAALAKQKASQLSDVKEVLHVQVEL